MGKSRLAPVKRKSVYGAFKRHDDGIPHAPERCEVDGKVRYLTRGGAELAMRRIIHDRPKPSHRPLNVYVCEHSGDWHVGHLPKTLDSTAEG